MSNEGEKCEVFFAEGQVKHATYGSLVGDQAVFKVLRWTGGSFQLDFEGKTDKETTRFNTQGSYGRAAVRWTNRARDSGGEAEPAPVEASPASAAPLLPCRSSGRPVPVSRREDEEEDVLLDG